jgi:hypothetical protein
MLRSSAAISSVVSFLTDGTRVLASAVIAEEKFPTRGKLSRRVQQLEVLPNRGMFFLEDVMPEALQEVLGTTEAVGVDPGQRALFTASNGLAMGLEEYRTIQGAAKSHRRAENHALEIDKRLPTLRVGTSVEYLAALVFRRRHWKELWTHHSAKWYQRAKFQQLRLGRRALQVTINRLQGRGETREYADPKRKRKSPFQVKTTVQAAVPIVFVGHAMMTGTPKGLGPVPVKKVLDEACKQLPVVLANEHRTSCTCSGCESKTKMKKPYAVQPDSKCLCGLRFQAWDVACRGCQAQRTSSLREVYGEFFCKGCARRWDRDVNAALNIQLVVKAYLRGAPRPSHLIS